MMKLDEGRFTQNDFLINNLNHPGTWHDFKTALTVQQPLYTPSLAPAREMAAKTALKEQLGHEATRQEVALLAERSDVSEELTRLESHLDQFSDWMASTSEVGKRMDFLLQEMQREANTILSKTTHLEITRAGVAITKRQRGSPANPTPAQLEVAEQALAACLAAEAGVATSAA
jgi:hypothetical protein